MNKENRPLVMGELVEGHFTHETESPWPLHFKHSHWWKKAEPPVQVHLSIWMQDGCRVYMDSYMATNGSCFMVTWITFKNHLLKVGLTQNRETIYGSPDAHNRWFILCYHVWGRAWLEIRWNSIWLRARSHMTLQYTWGSVTTLHDFGGVLERPLDRFFWASHNHGSWLVCKVALSLRHNRLKLKTSGKLPIVFIGIYVIYLNFNKEKSNDVNV